MIASTSEAGASMHLALRKIVLPGRIMTLYRPQGVCTPDEIALEVRVALPERASVGLVVIDLPVEQYEYMKVHAGWRDVNNQLRQLLHTKIGLHLPSLQSVLEGMHGEKALMRKVCNRFAAWALAASRGSFDCLVLDCSDDCTDDGRLWRESFCLPLCVLEAVRGIWPDDKPISLVLSVKEWSDDSFIEASALFKEYGCDMLGLVIEEGADEDISDYRVQQSTAIRTSPGMTTALIGGITGIDEAYGHIQAGRTDLCMFDGWGGWSR